MNEPTEKKASLWRRFSDFQNWRFSETILLSGVCLMGVLILTIHLATWGREVRRDSKRLISTACVVKDRVVRGRDGASGNTRFRPEIKIQYEYSGKPYEIWTWERATLKDDQGFIYDADAAKEIASGYKVGGAYRCWVRVANPEQAFLVKNSTVWGWVFLIIPVSLILFGGGILCVRLGGRAKSKEALASLKRQETKFPNVPVYDEQKGESLAKRLHPDVRSSFAFVMSAIGACVWNLASWAGFFYVLASSESSRDYWYAGLFGALFCGIGLLFACRLWGQYRIERVVGSTELEISTSPIVPGRKARLCLFLKGRIVAKRLDVLIACEEIARYVQGTNSITNRHEIFSRTLFIKYDVDVPANNEEREYFFIQLPIGVPHSFAAEHNEIAWRFTVQFEFDDGGVFTRNFAVAVQP